ncbi:MAG: thioredoxin family protein [Candidatus Gracilibacteria bacterium]
MVLTYSKMVPLGSPANDFKLKGIDEKFHSLAEYKEAKVLVIIFMCNHCPYVQKIWEPLVALSNHLPKEVQFIGINSNANQLYPEDSFVKMKQYATEKGQTFPYLYDEGQEVATSYQAVCTPDFFVYNKDQKLAYRGSFDGLKSAIIAILDGKEAKQEQTSSMGCSIKWA